MEYEGYKESGSEDSVLESLIDKYRERSKKGIKKYGTSLDRQDLELAHWCTHLQEELMDASLYLEKIQSLLESTSTEFIDEGDMLQMSKYKSKTLNKPVRTPNGPKKFSVYVKNPKTGKIIKVNFGDPNMKIRKSDPARRKSFRARHNCDNPGPKTKARYWSCKNW